VGTEWSGVPLHTGSTKYMVLKNTVVLVCICTVCIQMSRSDKVWLNNVS